MKTNTCNINKDKLNIMFLTPTKSKNQVNYVTKKKEHKKQNKSSEIWFYGLDY